MYYIGLDVHKRTISYCVKDAAGHVHQEGKIGSTRRELDAWSKTLPQPRMIAMEATIFTGWIYDQLLPHAEKVKVAHPLMLSSMVAKPMCLPGVRLVMMTRNPLPTPRNSACPVFSSLPVIMTRPYPVSD